MTEAERRALANEHRDAVVPGSGVAVEPKRFPALALGTCACGHSWLRHDVQERRGDGSELCCVDGCEQVGCPGRAPAAP